MPSKNSYVEFHHDDAIRRVFGRQLGFPSGSKRKNLSSSQETRVQSLVSENPLEKGMATHSSMLAWRIPWAEEPGGYSPWGHKELDTTERLT